MRTIATILVIFLARCTYLRAEPKPGFKEDVGDFFHSNSCIFGVKSISTFLYNSRNPEGKKIEVGKYCDDLDSSKRIFFIVHGFISSANTSRTRELASRLVQKDNTVIALDWSQGACTDGIPVLKFMEYPNAVTNTRDVGHLMARHVISLIQNCGVSLKNITFMGHSLGAHVCGFAAKKIQKLNYDTIPLLFAFDPATPMFGDNNCTERLCTSDAKRLVSFHTSSLGMSYNISDFDLWFHNGRMQPGCGVNIACSHSRSIDYMIDLLKDNCGFPGVPMEKKRSVFGSAPSPPGPETKDCIVVNSKLLDYDNPMKGQYYVFVKSAEPHCTQETYSCQQQ